MIKVDLHTHSEASKDGGIRPGQYAKLLKNETLDVIAITDHDRIDFAVGMQKALGADKIIVGQEVTTTDGDILGLYLTKEIPAGLSPKEAVDQIHSQKGLVCVPHPFETVRKGISRETLEIITSDVDIIEGFNGRALVQNYGSEAIRWAKTNGKHYVASSDAHGYKGAGKTYTEIQKHPKTATELLSALHEARLVNGRPPLRTLLYPSINMIKKLIMGYR